MNKRFVLSILPICAAAILSAQPIWQIDFKNLTDDVKKAIQLKGVSEITQEGLVTTSDTAKPHSVAVIPAPITEIPNGFDGKMLRVKWSFIPQKIGGWGNDFRIGSSMVVELTGVHPTLNAKRLAKSAVEAGKPCVMTCDFTQYVITSWTIDGKEQLPAPVPAWNVGGGKLTINLSDFNDTNSKTTWLGISFETIQYKNVEKLRLAAGDAYPPIEKDKKADFLLGHASPMQKIFREAQLYVGDFSRNIRIAAAGREHESFQLVVFPLDKPLKNVTVTVSDLQSLDGRLPVFPASRISVHPIGYIRTEVGPKAGWQWPDILMPYKPFDVEPGFVQPVWFTVDVPHGTAAGEYRGIIEIKADGVEPQMASLSLTVRPFSLPLRGKLKTAFCICPGMWEIWYKPDEVKKRLGMTDQTNHGVLYTSYECEDVLPKAKWLEMYDFLLAHRISPTVIYSGLKKGKSRVVPAMEDMQYCYDRGMNATCLMCVSDISEDQQKAQETLAAIDNWLSEWEKFVKEKDWKDFTWYLHSYDETEMLPADRKKHMDYAITTTHQHIKQKFPWIKRETANPYMERHKDDFDIWTPVTSQINDKTVENYRKAQADGQEAWAYVCCGPGRPYANFFIDFDGVCPRVLPWQFYQYKLTGFLYYLINHYQPTKNWNMNAPKWPDEPWNCFSYNTNSDGILIYPGPDAMPLASTRLENLRDGIEDYEALAILQELAAKFTPKNDDEKALLAEAEELVKVPAELSESWTKFTKDPKIIEKTRAKIDELIQKLQ
ncbi:MAG: DUF4091 domain-containing protein [Victivallales bacterium]|nr:DUF4091 domain-containing protein [Victivallales bacterium]